MKYTDVAWDFDGTLIDTYACLVPIYQEMLEEYGCMESKEEIHSKLSISMGYAHEHYAEKYGMSSGDLKERYSELRRIKGLCTGEMRVYPGVEAVLKAIKKLGGRNHLYTNRDCSALKYLEAYGLLQYFDGLVTSENIGNLKPAPDGMYILFEQFNIDPTRMLMIGDRAVDVQAAKAAGADACFYNTNHIEVPEGVDIEITDMMDLLRYL